MLEQKIKNVTNRLALGLAGLGLIAGAYGCAHIAKVPIRYYSNQSTQTPIAQCSGISCCDMLNCNSKSKDYCRDDGEEWLDGILYDVCSCHDYASSGGSSSSSSSSSWSDKGGGGYDRDRSGSSGGGKSGSVDCFKK